MPRSVDTGLWAIWNWMLTKASKLSGKSLAWGGLALAAVILLSLNLTSSISLRNFKADLTEEGLFTISDGTKSILRNIEEPVTVHLYFSRKLGELAPHYARYFDRVRAMLEQYRDLSGGKLRLAFHDPEPFSDEEDKAVAGGLRGLRLNNEGELGYFGLTANNSTDNQGTISFFSLDRENFLEYDVTKLIHSLSKSKKRVVGVLSSLPLQGGKAPITEQILQPWLILEQMKEFFEVEMLDQARGEIPDNIDVLLIAQPAGLRPATAYAIDQYAMKGGKVLVLIDPTPEAAQAVLLSQDRKGLSILKNMLKGWGVDYDSTKVAADIKHARRVQFPTRQGDKPLVTDFVAWLALDRTSMDEGDVLSGGIEQLSFGSSGSLSKADGASITFTPLVRTSSEAMQIGAEKVGMGADPLALIRNYKPEGKRLTLAARITGEAKSAFPDGKPSLEDDEAANPGVIKSEDDKAKTPAAPKDPKALEGHVASGKINAIIIADTDFLADQFWVQTREIMGQPMQVPVAHNAAFLLGALENLTGTDDLIALRGRGVKDRKFTMVDDIRRRSEQQFREKEQALTKRLKEVESEIQKLEIAGEGGAAILSDRERSEIEKFRAEMLDTRRQLRDVKLALRRDIDRLDGWLKFANIALVPTAIGLAGLGWTYFETRRRRNTKTSDEERKSA
jgi:ABC-type uncharacterized transport system involved in gliding motility auxiliary subunit